ncbi:branched-chain amino acid ABC transporter permease [Hydrogenophaga sp. SL48]|jgi:branched-chain amino acid transport system permease protein|uniref:branched-chain amino acid ABC transporter permease n=1 Tax=Hydrogenophaga sp. SL48 TaxID=2806347 RepID=UPI001F4893B0|nr:branched-chain amino acid ABC transporter permease [Hydrogenophaga sp. SL48]UJW82809.1 branched-chain amino acid ABC transporter permease [Hydrogenophaga sp. SL48]
MSTAKAQLEKLPRSMQVMLAIGAVALAAFPLMPLESRDFYLQMLTQMMILAIFAMSLDLLQGVTGLVSLGHAAYFGLAGYALAFITPQDAPIALWWSLPLAAAGAGLAALVIGFFVVRTHGIYFIMVTMAFAQMVFFLFFDNKALGGSDGIYVNFRPDATALGIDLENKAHFFYFTLAMLIGVYLFLRRVLFSPFGRVLAGIRVNEHRMRAVGYGSFGYKLAAFTLAGTLAGVAGYLWAAQTGFVNPELMGFHMSAHAIMMVILGGMGNFAGAIVGAFAFEYVMHFFKDLPAIGDFETGKHWQLWMGSFIVLVVIVAPRGLLGLGEKFLNRKGTQK